MLHDRITRLGVSVILSVVAYQAAARDIVLMNAPYLNPQLAVEDRVKDLVGRMSPDEKCAQIGLVVGFDAFVRDAAGKLHVEPAFAQALKVRPFRRLIRAGARQIMCTYNTVDGEHCSSSPYQLDEILRRQLGFKGVVNGDAGSIQGAASHRMCKDIPHAAAKALKAGCDTEFDIGRWKAGDLFKAGYDAGLISDADLNKAVSRLLKIKFELGFLNARIESWSVLPAFSWSQARRNQLESPYRPRSLDGMIGPVDSCPAKEVLIMKCKDRVES